MATIETDKRAGAVQGEVRMLIDGELVEAASGKRFDNINPATEEVLGQVADAVGRRHGAAPSPRPGARSTRPTGRPNRALRQRCLAAAAGRHRERAGGAAAPSWWPRSAARSRSPTAPARRAARGRPRSGRPRSIDEFEWERDLPDGHAFGSPAGARSCKEPAGVVGAIVPWNYPFEVTLAEAGPGARHRQHHDRQARARHAVERHPPRSPGRRADRHPRRRVQRRHVVGPPRRRGARPRPARRPHLVHRLDRDRPAHHGEGRADDEAPLPRARRQVGRHRPRRRRPRGEAARRPACVCIHGGQGCAMLTRMLVPRTRYDEASSSPRRASRNVPYGDPTDPGNLQGPQISAKQRERVLGYIEKGVAEGARLVVGGGRPAHLEQGLVRRADAVRRRRQLDDDRPGGDLRAGARRHPVRRRRRRRAHRQRQPVRPRRVCHLGFDERALAVGAPHPGRDASASTAASPTAPTRRSAATRPAASAARTASRASSSTRK